MSMSETAFACLGLDQLDLAGFADRGERGLLAGLEAGPEVALEVGLRDMMCLSVNRLTTLRGMQPKLPSVWASNSKTHDSKLGISDP